MVGCAYAAAEVSCVVLLPWLRGESYSPVHPAFSILTAVVYCVLAAGAGFAASSFLPGDQENLSTTGAATLLIILTTVNAGLYGPVVSALAAGVAMLVVVLVAFMKRSDCSSAFMAAAAAGDVVLVAIGSSSFSARLRVVGMAALALALVAMAVASPSLRLSRARVRTVVVTASLIVLGLSLLPNQPVHVISIPSPLRQATGSSPNVILITLDTVRADHMSLYGYGRETTPVLSGLASQADVYSAAFSAGDMTLSGHASIMTGLYASHHGAHYIGSDPAGHPLDTRTPTLAELMANRGYFCAGAVANLVYLTHTFGFDRGFHVFDERWRVPLLAPAKPVFLREALADTVARFISPVHHDAIWRDADEINGAAFSLLHQAKELRRPVFLFLNYMDAHEPYLPPPPFRFYFSREGELTCSKDYREIRRQVMSGVRPLRGEEHERLLAQYDGAIAYEDAALGRLFAFLRRENLYDNSIIIVTSDHGEAFGEHGVIEHGASVYQDQIHVPLLIKGVQQRNGIRRDGPVSLVDIVPTILEMTRDPGRHYFDGISLLRPSRGRSVMAQSFMNPNLALWNKRYARRQDTIIGDFKLIRTSPGSSMELYDIRNDAGETRNIVGLRLPEARRLSDALTTALSPRAGLRHEFAPVDEETIRRLRAIGYVH